MDRMGMIMGQAIAAKKFGFWALLAAVMALGVAFATPQDAMAQDAVETAEATEVAEASAGYTPMAPEADKGQPTNPLAETEDAFVKSMTFQDQYTADGKYALGMHDYLLLPVITGISLFVLALLLWVIVRYRRGANPNPSRTTHNTLIEVVWTVVPALILVVIAVPSLTLLAAQYENPPEEAVTVKAIGHQWFWTYEYPDHGGVNVVSRMLDEESADARGEPFQLAADNRMVVPAGVPLRIQVTASDVIHAFAVPALWFKQDAVPGRLTERLLIIEEPGVYYGQCSELCGALHGYMPITVEALPMEEFEAWVLENNGTLPGAEEVAEADADAETDSEEAGA